MNVPLTRRSVECVSDLTIDRWLLGETPGSDEARRLEQHMQRCAVCAARLGSLRNLYSNQPDPVATTTARALEAPPRPSPAETGVLQVIVMRDGLLVGTEYFTPGRWVVGSAPGADLTLIDGPLGRHAALTFHAGTVGLEAREGVVFVNGVRLQRAEVRPIDEVWVGPYALRVRVITERWSWPAMVTQPLPAPPQAGPTIVEPPTPQDTRLEVSMWWGDTRVSTCCATDRLTAGDVAALGFERPVLASRGALGRWDVTTPSGALTLSLHEATAVEHGTLKLLLKVTGAPAALGRAPSRERLFPAVLLSTLVASAALLVSMPERTDDEDFSPRPLPAVTIHVTPPAPKPPTPQPASAPDPTSPPAVAAKASPRHQRASPPPPKNRFEALDRVMRSATSATAALTKLGSPGARSRRGPAGPLVAMPGVGAPLLAVGVGTHDSTVGRAGARLGGDMRGGGYGREGKVGGLVVGPVRPAGLSLPKKDGGHVDRDAVAKVIAEHLQEVQRCYEASMLLEGSSGGRLLVEWTIAPSGAVAQAKVASTSLKQASVPQCVLTALRRWAFPKPKGGNVVVSYPFVFQSSSFR
ncbi:MAG: AgmX/PglI C-terminal domain-containing protein [Myxococcaceae bacterium]|nr:AgmX/PglI C-terminal domain-containing protein [Myxococcaceae bacterium]